MFSRLFYRKNNVIETLLLLLLCLFTANYSLANGNTDLTIDDAGKIALERDDIVKSYLSLSNAMQDESIALNTLPDPKFKLGLLNVPTDSYDLDQENMTQKKIGFVQMFPKGNSLEIKSQRAIIRSDRNTLKADERKRSVLDKTRKAWLEVYYWINAKKIL